MFPRNGWYVAAWAHEVGQAPLGRTLAGEMVVLVRGPDGTAHGFEDRCAHRFLPLSKGRVVPEGLQCGYHGVVFGWDGACVHIPGQDQIPPSARVRRFPLVERDALLWIWPGDPALADPALIPQFPWHNDRVGWPMTPKHQQLRCAHSLIIDNLVDLTHLAYVHTRTIGGNPPAEHARAEMTVEARPRGVRFVRVLRNSTPPPTYSRAVPLPAQVDRWMDFEFIAPSAVLQYSACATAGAFDAGGGEGGFRLRMFHGLTPETDRTSHYFWSVCTGYRQDDPAANRSLLAEIEPTFMEDVAVLEAQQQAIEAMGDRPSFALRADQPRVLARKALERMLTAETGTRAAE